MVLGVASYGDISSLQAFTAEFVGTFILVFTIFGVIHRKAAAGFAGVAIGLVVFAAIIPVAPATGASINPARTVGPMLVQQLAGGEVKWAQLPVYLAASSSPESSLPSCTACSPARRLTVPSRLPGWTSATPTRAGHHASDQHRLTCPHPLTPKRDSHEEADQRPE